MAQATLYSESLTYPTISAVANGKLEFDKEDVLILQVPFESYAVIGKRQTASDPWEIEILARGSGHMPFEFSAGEFTVNPDDFGWKSMADLALKIHSRTANEQKWELTKWVSWCMLKADAAQPLGYNAATLAQAKEVIWADIDESGAARVHYKAASGQALLNSSRMPVLLISAAIANILADTTTTSAEVVIPNCIVSGRTDDFEAVVEHRFKLKKLSGTEAISLGNFSYGTKKVRVTAGGTALPALHVTRRVETGEAYAIPSINVDTLRKTVKAGGTAMVSAVSDVESGAVSLELNWTLSAVPTDDVDLAYVSVADPNGFIEVDFDQANSLNVLAAAAFAGLGGLVGVGVATELENLLANSNLAPLFSQVATILGSTTAAVITGYVGALVAAYTQGWISNEQLFNLSNHANWIRAGASTIALAATAGVAVTEVGSLLSYLGVTNNVLGIAMQAAGGATTAAGVALGMASVMAKSVRHSYWGA